MAPSQVYFETVDMLAQIRSVNPDGADAYQLKLCAFWKKNYKAHKAAWAYKCPDTVKEALRCMFNLTNQEQGKPMVDDVSVGGAGGAEATSTRDMEISEATPKPTPRLVSQMNMSRGRSEIREGTGEGRSEDHEVEAKRTKYDSRPVNHLRKELRSFQNDERLKEFDTEVKFEHWIRDVSRAIEVQFGHDWTHHFSRVSPHLSLAMAGTLTVLVGKNPKVHR